MIKSLCIFSAAIVVCSLAYVGLSPDYSPKVSVQSASESGGEYQELKQSLKLSLDSKDVSPKLKINTSKLIEDIDNVMVEADDADTSDINLPPYEEIVESLEIEYQKRGLSYEAAQAEIEAALSAETTDPELIELNRKIREEISE